jgi:hypothetical protein
MAGQPFDAFKHDSSYAGKEPVAAFRGIVNTPGSHILEKIRKPLNSLKHFQLDGKQVINQIVDGV